MPLISVYVSVCIYIHVDCIQTMLTRGWVAVVAGVMVQATVVMKVNEGLREEENTTTRGNYYIVRLAYLSQPTSPC